MFKSAYAKLKGNLIEALDLSEWSEEPSILSRIRDLKNGLERAKAHHESQGVSLRRLKVVGNDTDGWEVNFTTVSYYGIVERVLYKVYKRGIKDDKLTAWEFTEYTDLMDKRIDKVEVYGKAGETIKRPLLKYEKKFPTKEAAYTAALENLEFFVITEI
jgi:hypothetical protein